MGPTRSSPLPGDGRPDASTTFGHRAVFRRRAGHDGGRTLISQSAPPHNAPMSRPVGHIFVLLLLVLAVAGLGASAVTANTKGLIMQEATQKSPAMPGMGCEDTIPTTPCDGQSGCSVPCIPPAVALPGGIDLLSDGAAPTLPSGIVPQLPTGLAGPPASPPPRSLDIA